MHCTSDALQHHLHWPGEQWKRDLSGSYVLYQGPEAKLLKCSRHTWQAILTPLLSGHSPAAVPWPGQIEYHQLLVEAGKEVHAVLQVLTIS